MPKPRVTLIGWIALAVSVFAAAGIYGFVWMLAYSGTTWAPDWVTFRNVAGYPLEIGAGLGLPAAIVLDTIAGTRGRKNQIAGTVGGFVLFLPIPLIFLGIFPTPY